MPLYTLRRLSTEEEWDVNCSFHDLAPILEDDDIVRVLKPPKFSAMGTKDNLSKAGSGWKDLLGRIKKGSGKNSKINL